MTHFIDQKTKTDMDLIDHFAGLAMHAFITKADLDTDISVIAEWAYDQALSMMAHRDEMFDGLPE